MGWPTTVRVLSTLVATTLAVAAPAQADDRWVWTDFADGMATGAAGVAIQPDGRIVLAGNQSSWTNEPDSTVSRIALARYNPDLTLDPSFSHDGRQTTDVDDHPSAWAGDVVLQADGKIVVAGSAGSSYPVSDFMLARYREDGSLDSSFGGDGIVTTDLGGSDTALAAAVQPDGKIVVGGYSEGRLAIARYRADGSLDTSFGGDGMATPAVGGGIRDLAIQDDGKLVVGGYEGLVRFEPDGSLDTSFGTGGVVTNDALLPTAVAIQPDGKIVAAGNGFTLARYHADGSLDLSFGFGGTQTSTILGTWNDIAILPNGKIVAVGED